jgi:hypothetical protein
LAASCVLATNADARPQAPEIFCETYPESQLCAGGAASCTTCHVLAGPPQRNAFGVDVAQAFTLAEFEEALRLALAEVEDLDSDGDGISNLAEIMAGTLPGFDSSIEPECGEQTLFSNPWYRVGEFDPAFAFKRVTLDFCGRSPRYEERLAFDDVKGSLAALTTQLEQCLESPYWQEVLVELAAPIVRPIGPATDVNILGNWAWDLRMFRWAMSGDRDAGELLTADYFVVEDPPLSGRLVTIDEPRSDFESFAQPLDAADRYGLITTRYSLAMNVMFAPVPRTLTAHIYRELLGVDIARSQGLFPVDELDGEYDWPAPADVDQKGVWQEECAGCHSTLDPLSYPWARYNGIDLDGGTTGAFLPDRATDIMPTTDGAIFGTPISTPQEWVDAAVNSDEFSQRIVSIVWGYLFRRPPLSCEQDEFDALRSGFQGGGRNVEAMLHRLILTDAYGAP